MCDYGLNHKLVWLLVNDLKWINMKKGRNCMLMKESCVVECVLVCMVRFWCKITACMCLNYVSKYVKGLV